MGGLERRLELEPPGRAAPVREAQQPLALLDQVCVPQPGVLLVEGDEDAVHDPGAEPRGRQAQERCQAERLGVVEQGRENDSELAGLDGERLAHPRTGRARPPDGVGAVDGLEDRR